MILKPVIDQFTRSEEFRSLKQARAGRAPGKNIFIEGVSPGSFPLITASLFSASPRRMLVVTETAQKMYDLYLDLSCMVDERLILTIPPWETLPYEFVSPPERAERERITALYRLLGGKETIFLTTVEGLMRKLPRRDFFLKKGIGLSAGEEYPYRDIIETLVAYGYSREYRVEAFGQFSVKGGIIDVFLPSGANPLRLEFFGDTLESIREFDAASQISLGTLKCATIYPRKELILSGSERETLLKILKKSRTQGIRLSDELETQMAEGRIGEFRGIEDLFPLAVNSDTLFSYFDEESVIVFLESAELIAKKNLLEKTFSELYARKRKKQLCLEPAELLDAGAFDAAMSRALSIRTFITEPGSFQWKIKSAPNFHGKIAMVRDELSKRAEAGWRTIITTSFEGQARRLFDLFGEFSPAGNFEKIDPRAPFSIIISPLTNGIEILGVKTLVLTDHDIFGKSYRKKTHFKKKTSRPIESFLDLNSGDFVVHINHGIGVFRGIERMAAGGVERDFLMIEYADSDKLYVSLDQIHMVQKYIGLEGRTPRIDNLGKKSAWNRVKDRVKESVAKIARELIDIYSRRNVHKGFRHPPDTLWQEEFESLFEYEETPDQITAIEDVKDDMESEKPMDRLICGDVGFGKTEVAIRAAFKTVMAGRQAAVLVPTTILALQHFDTFKRRFAGYPIDIEMVSRFRSRAEIAVIREKLAAGKIDIIIGTHALLAKDIVIKNLGLVVIDEEQKFGVRHKERLKQIRTLVDVMTLSATPIPRTLHLSLANIRDLSIISTPPENRQSIETYVLVENPDILRKAILTEIEREGQLFYVHNRVQTIEAQKTFLEKLAPEASFCIAHGQMDENALEDVMIDFMNRQFDALVCTSIIESGLDMPNVNTIIINRADAFGLSQLYQLKGRVGRSEKKAYAYLFYPAHTALTEEAEKRLRVIAEYTELGSGFKIAMKDLEIRGAGNILGAEQSGNIMEVGFDLYTQMLSDEVKKLKGEKPSTLYRTPVFIKTSFFIPGTYMADERQKIEFYKRFESCETVAEVDELEHELADRFGPPPAEVASLVELEKIRALASALLIDEILEETRGIKIKMTKDTLIDVRKIVKELSKKKWISVDPSDSEILIFAPPEKEREKRVHELKKWLQQIS